MRGKLAIQIFSVVTPGITPAGAGKTCMKSDFKFWNGDHPRRCGENTIKIMKRRNMLGSPPQVRGKQIYFDESVLTARITPAGAGKTQRRYKRLDCLLGSPPQVRGKHDDNIKSVVTQRITPAGAGKTFKRVAFSPAVKDHPRRCGENYKIMLIKWKVSGSPPQVRGKLRSTKRIHAC